jgi:hypothetical protein
MNMSVLPHGVQSLVLGYDLRYDRPQAAMSRVIEGVPTRGEHRTTRGCKKIFVMGKTSSYKQNGCLARCALVPLKEYRVQDRCG